MGSPQPSVRPAGPATATRWERLEWVACLVVLAVASGLHIYNVRAAGGLWRDEIGGVNLATQTSLGEMWSALMLDSFPVAMPLLLRAWHGLGMAGGDVPLRILGMLIGMALLGAVARTARALALRPPLIALALLATNTAVIRWGDSLRGYGLGSVFIVLALGAMWRLVQQPNRRRFGWAALLAVLCVQTLYQNAFLLLAISLGAATVAATRRDWRAVRLVLGAGIAAALSLLPYLPGMIASQKWWLLQKTGFQPEWVWDRFQLALSAPTEWQALLWLALGLAGVVTGIAALVTILKSARKPANHPEVQPPERRVFAAVTVFSAVPLFGAFLWLSGMPIQTWYFLPLLAVVGVGLDALLTEAAPGFAWWRLGLLAAMCLAPLGESIKYLQRRLTNADLILPEIAQEATANDLVIAQPWYVGTVLRRYYHGPARWIGLPPVADYRWQRFDQLREKILAGQAAAPVLEECRKTLEAGHRVYLVGLLHFFELPPVSPEDPPPPAGPTGWEEIRFESAWFGQVAHFLTLNTTNAPRTVMPPDTGVFEDIEYQVFSGKSPTAPP